MFNSCKIVLGISVVVFASGCSTYSNEFDCPIGSGMRCASISRVNKAYDRGLIDVEDYFDDELNQLEPKLQTAPINAPIKIWVAPHVSDTGQIVGGQEVTM